MLDATRAPIPGRDLTKRQRIQARATALRTEQERWASAWWRDIRDYCLPQHGAFLATDRENMTRNTSRILSGTATQSLITLSNGLMAGITSPARKWFALGLSDKELEQYKPVAMWLEQVTDIMLGVLRKSNLYKILPGHYLELGAFGTAAMGAFEDFDDVVRFYPYPIGSYCVGLNDRLKPDTFERRCLYSVRQLVDRFGYDRLSQSSKALWQAGNTEAKVEVCQVVMPNPEANPKKLGARFKPYTSFYYETAAPMEGEAFLADSGFDSFPILITRWSTVGEDPYGLSPTMNILGDIKELQALKKQKGRAIEKMVDPPLMGPSYLRQQQVSTQPNRITYIDTRDGMDGLRPIYQVNLPIGEVRQDLLDVRQAIRDGLYTDYFRKLTDSTRRQVTAEEIRALAEEKIANLSPLLEQVDDELLDPLIDRTYQICDRFRMFPPPPPELQGKALRVEYTSIMAQAQKAMGLSGQERLLSYIGVAAQLDPSVLDTVDFDADARSYADGLGTPASSLRSPEEVAQRREQRAAAQQQQAAVEQAKLASETARNLSQTDTTSENGLTDLASDDG